MLRARTPISKIKAHDIPEPSKLNSDQMLLPYLSKEGELISMSCNKVVNQSALDTRLPLNEKNPYSLQTQTLRDSKSQKDFKNDYMGNRIMTLYEHEVQKKKEQTEKRLKKNRQIQRNFQNRSNKTSPRKYDYLTK